LGLGKKEKYMNSSEIRSMNARNEERGWSAVPDSCPPIFQAKIAEMRAANLRTGKNVWTFATAIPGARVGVEIRSAGAPSGRRNQVSLEERFRQQTGREYVSDQELRMRLANLGRQVEVDRRALDAENERAARNAAIVNAELFPWQVN
jgi:hypothetical protein